MAMKTIIAAAAITTAALSASAPANAKVNLDVYLGGVGPGYYEPAYPVYDAPRYYEPRQMNYGISCGEGREEVRYAGFHRVKPLDCNGRRYTYAARKHGKSFIVVVSRRSGEIVSVDRRW